MFYETSKKTTFDDKMKDAKQWIADPNAPPGGEGNDF